MSPMPTDELERQLGSALTSKAATVTGEATIEGRATIGRRVAQRARHRRTVRAVASVVMVAVLLAAGLFWWRDRGEGDDKVVTGPGVPAVQLPHVGLTGPRDTWQLKAYSPGRWEELLVFPAGTPRGEGPYALLITPDASAGKVSLPTTPHSTETATVNGKPATVIALQSPTPAAAILWEIAPGLKAMLATDGPIGGGISEDYRTGATWTTPPPRIDSALANRLLATADRIGSVDDATWFSRLRSGGISRPTPLAAPLVPAPSRGHAELDGVEPPFFMSEHLDVPGFRPGTVTIAFSAYGPVDLKGKGLHPVSVRGTQGIFADSPIVAHRPQTHGLTWFERGLRVTIAYEGGATRRQVIDLADSLVVATAAQWRSLVEPSTLRLDLDPMPKNLFTNFAEGNMH